MNKQNSKFTISKCLWCILWVSIGIYIIWVGLDLKEGYRNTNTSYSVDLPINTTTSCSNFCGPQAICSITGEQCSSDPDCYGCAPPVTPPSSLTTEVSGYNDAGKLSDAMTPVFSVLTTDIGTHAFKMKGPNTPPPNYSKGVNTWRRTFDEGQRLYETRYNPQFQIINSLPKYPSRPTLTGEFVDTGPLPANATL